MTNARLAKTRIREGVWEGVLSGAGDSPAIEVLHLEKPLSGVVQSAIPGQEGEFLLRIPIPIESLNEGVQTFLVRDVESGDTLTHFTIITGVAMEDDMRAEVDLLRAELDMLKRAFRRHCLETGG